MLAGRNSAEREWSAFRAGAELRTLGQRLATIGYQSRPVAFLASMIGLDATYEVVATWSGTKQIRFDGTAIETRLINAEP